MTTISVPRQHVNNHTVGGGDPPSIITEYITEGDFSDSGNAWDLGVGWSVVAGVATSPSQSTSPLEQTFTRLVIGRLYRLAATVVRGIEYDVTVELLSETSTDEILSFTADGTQSVDFVAESDYITIRIRWDAAPGEAGTFTVDDISLSALEG